RRISAFTSAAVLSGTRLVVAGIMTVAPRGKRPVTVRFLLKSKLYASAWHAVLAVSRGCSRSGLAALCQPGAGHRFFGQSDELAALRSGECPLVNYAEGRVAERIVRLQFAHPPGMFDRLLMLPQFPIDDSQGRMGKGVARIEVDRFQIFLDRF